jgi:hypothetical protein
MATITTLSAGTYATANIPTRHMDNTNLVYKVWRELDIAAAVTAKGSALAQADVIEALRLPAGVQVLAAGAQKTAAMTGTTADLTIDLGITGVNADAYAAAWAFPGAAVGSYATPLGDQTVALVVSTTDTIDILLKAMTGTLTGGKIMVWAVVVDITPEQRGVIAQPKS